MTVHSLRRKPFGPALLLALSLGLAAPVAAQGLFSAQVLVNDKAVTQYEINQRVQLLQFFGQRGDLASLARTQLVDEALRAGQMDRDGFMMTQESYTAALNEFAAGNRFQPDQLLQTLKQAGVDEATLRAYLGSTALWRDYIRARFGSEVQVSDAELDAFITRSQTSSAGVEVLLSEFIVPLLPEHMAEIRSIVARVSQMNSTEAFSAAAREYSVVPSRDNGGRLDWAPVSNFPPALAQLLTSLKPGQVTPPLDINNGVALLQMRGVREGRIPAATIASVDYASFSVPAPEIAMEAFAKSQTCDELYGHLPAGTSVERKALAPSELSQTISVATSKLDTGEWTLASQSATSLSYVMLCARTPATGEGGREAALNALRSQKLQSYADALVAELRANATIVNQ